MYIFVQTDINKNHMRDKLYNNRIRVLLAEQMKTGKWLATELGVAEITVSRWCTNKSQPSMSQFINIAKALKVDYADLIEEEKK